MAKPLAEKMGVKLNIVQVTGPNRIPYLLSGQADLLISSLAFTPQRAERSIPLTLTQRFVSASQTSR